MAQLGPTWRLALGHFETLGAGLAVIHTAMPPVRSDLGVIVPLEERVAVWEGLAPGGETIITLLSIYYRESLHATT